MEFIKTNPNNGAVITRSCNNKCGGNCNNQSDSYAKNVGSNKKS